MLRQKDACAEPLTDRPTREGASQGGAKSPSGGGQCAPLKRAFPHLFAVMEPEEGAAHNVFVDGMLMRPGSEDYNLPPAPEPVDQFRRFLDTQVQVSEGT
jgi:hypothetical protein